MKLVYVYMTLGVSKLVAGVDDGAGKLRRVEVQWQSKSEPYLPPVVWVDTARREAEFQKSDAANPNPVRMFL